MVENRCTVRQKPRSVDRRWCLRRASLGQETVERILHISSIAYRLGIVLARAAAAVCRSRSLSAARIPWAVASPVEFNEKAGGVAEWLCVVRGHASCNQWNAAGQSLIKLGWHSDPLDMRMHGHVGPIQVVLLR